MNTGTLLSCFLILHLSGLIIMAGTTLIDYISYKTFWKLFNHENEKSAGVLALIGKLPRFSGIGAALLILSGIGMMALTHGVFGEQLWFRIKFALVIILIVNTLLVARRQGTKLRKLINTDGPGIAQQASHIKTNMNRFHMTQLGIFFIIIFLSVFKFN